ncbi:MAG: heme ABC exporter ATP-binding protein CcmA [Anaerolineales bacterium]
MIRARQVSKRFGYQFVLQGVDLEVPKGEIVALLGPNGAGKTTFLRILATLVKPTSGQILVAGFDLSGEAHFARAKLGYQAHQHLLYGDLSAQQNLALFARLHGLPKPARRISQLLDLFDLVRRRTDPVRVFSRGMQQRLSLARVLLHEPKVLLLDEPHNSLDKDATILIDGILRDLAKRGCSLLFATHDSQRALSLADRIEIIAGGQLTSVSTRRISESQLSKIYQRAVQAEKYAT